MPELPEAERARLQIEKALDREIVAVDDRDTYVSRPHAPGEIAQALTGRRLVKAHRRGKFLWVETDGGPDLGLHLGMAGRIVVDEPPHTPWDRFALEFSDGGRLALRDKRRLGRAVIQPDFSHVGPDAADIGRNEFRARVGKGTAPIKARLLDQKALSGVGNLLADENLWQARISPRRPAGGRRRGGPRPPRRGAGRSPTCAGPCAPPCAARSRRAAHTPGASSPTARRAITARAAARASSARRSA